MKTSKISSDFIFTGSSEPLTDSVLIYNEEGKILAIDKLADHDTASINFFRGILCPGFINAHCHLELSHMKGIAPSGTSLIPFIINVVTKRDFPLDQILEAIEKADKEMWENGIVAVGDISNQNHTFNVKENSPISYYTFVEMFDFMQDQQAADHFKNYGHTAELFASQKNKVSLVPHAPYSVSPTLFSLLSKVQKPGDTISMHNQETPPEIDMFANRTGGFIDLFEKFGNSMSHFKSTWATSLNYALQNMKPSKNTILVHNTLTQIEDIEEAHSWGNNIFWATCPNANLFIENRMPNYSIFKEKKAKMVIGTDSLTSNWSLSILEEIKTILKFQSTVSLSEVLSWATLNGAEALQYDDNLGSFTKNKIPGINLIINENPKRFSIDNNTLVVKVK